MEKNSMLKGAGIALIVLGVFDALGALICFVAGDLIAGILGGVEGGEAAGALIGGIVMIAGIILLVVAAAYIAAGVIGIKQKSPKTCFVVAIILMVVCGLAAIGNLIEGLWLSAVIVIIAPVFYLVGAIQLKKAVAEAEANVEQQ